MEHAYQDMSYAISDVILKNFENGGWEITQIKEQVSESENTTVNVITLQFTSF